MGSDVGFNSEGNVTIDPAEILDGGAIRNFTRSAWKIIMAALDVHLAYCSIPLRAYDCVISKKSEQ